MLHIKNRTINKQVFKTSNRFKKRHFKTEITGDLLHDRVWYQKGKKQVAKINLRMVRAVKIVSLYLIFSEILRRTGISRVTI